MNQPICAADLMHRVQNLIGPALLEADRIFDAELASSNPYLTDILAHTARFRGKRLRPTLLLLVAATQGEITDNHLRLAAVIEMIHTATLVHDDVLDRADVRRHVATVHHRWNRETSVLFGDYLFTHAFHLAASTGSTLACRLIGRATNRVCEGELTQIDQRGNLDLTEQQYFDIIEGKTAELCAIACFLGAHFGGVNDEVAQTMDGYGRALGSAFQVADDVLDLLGDEAQTGKTLGTDVGQQKLTLPLIRLLQTADAAAASQYRQWLVAGDDEAMGGLRDALESSDALVYTSAQAERFAADARACLTRLPATPARELLAEFTLFAIHRTA